MDARCTRPNEGTLVPTKARKWSKQVICVALLQPSLPIRKSHAILRSEFCPPHNVSANSILWRCVHLFNTSSNELAGIIWEAALNVYYVSASVSLLFVYI
jgi:hypothetical protein